MPLLDTRRVVDRQASAEADDIEVALPLQSGEIGNEIREVSLWSY